MCVHWEKRKSIYAMKRQEAGQRRENSYTDGIQRSLKKVRTKIDINEFLIPIGSIK